MGGRGEGEKFSKLTGGESVVSWVLEIVWVCAPRVVLGVSPSDGGGEGGSCIVQICLEVLSPFLVKLPACCITNEIEAGSSVAIGSEGEV
jgi:hypothetical protein